MDAEFEKELKRKLSMTRIFSYIFHDNHLVCIICKKKHVIYTTCCGFNFNRLYPKEIILERLSRHAVEEALIDDSMSGM